MLFNTLEFGIFFLVVWALYLVSPHRVQNRLLLVASYFFYGCWDARFLSLIIISTVVDYVAGRKIDAASDLRRKRSWLLLSMVTNLGLLGFFKYAGFFVDSAGDALRALGLDPGVWHLDIVLPVGISFYTFQTMSYTIDIYRGRLRPVHGILDFALFVSFFPQLVAGPIERAANLLPQVTTPRTVDRARLREGALLVCGGLFKKMFIADNCAVIVDGVFGSAGPVAGGEWAIAVYAFALQVYGDFAGYSDIARGLGKLMGFDLMLNFNLPYFAVSPSDLWRRWHISLSTWLRDYLYISLGGSRRGELRTNVNLFLTMALGGLWHGANWSTVLWGVFHGVILIVYRLVERATGVSAEELANRSRVLRVVLVIVMFNLFCLALLIFRAESMPQLGTALAALWAGHAGAEFSTLAMRLGLLGLPLLAVQLVQEQRGDLLLLLRLRPPVRMGIFVALLTVAAIHWLLFAQGFQAGEEFIYFQF